MARVRRHREVPSNSAETVAVANVGSAAGAESDSAPAAAEAVETQASGTNQVTTDA